MKNINYEKVSLWHECISGIYCHTYMINENELASKAFFYQKSNHNYTTILEGCHNTYYFIDFVTIVEFFRFSANHKVCKSLFIISDDSYMCQANLVFRQN